MKDTTDATMTVIQVPNTCASIRITYIVRVNGTDKEFTISEFAFAYAQIVALIPDVHVCILKRTIITEILS